MASGSRTTARTRPTAGGAPKVAFYFQLRALGANTPEVVAENAAGRLIFFTDCDDYEALLAARGELVVKPREGHGGKGVRIVRPR